MKKTREVNVGFVVLTAIMTLILVLMLGLFGEGFSLVSHAESQGKVIADSANIRKSPNVTSDIIGSTEKDKPISIKSQTKGSDDKIWYQVFVDANTLGYIRSDLVSITDGTTPPTQDAPAQPSTPTPEPTPEPTPTPPAPETAAEVEAVNPVSATVSGSASVRVRANASTNSQIVTTAKEGENVVVNGRATGTDSKLWYQVTFISNGTEVTGFIRSDYVQLSEELTPYTPEVPEEPEPEAPTEEPEAPVQQKVWDTQNQNGDWYLINNDIAKQYAIDEIFEGVERNAQLFAESEKTVKKQKGIIVFLTLLVILLAAAIAYIIFKMKDSMDDSYFAQVEKETLRKKSERQQGSGQRVMHTMGAERQGRPQGTRPQGQRPQGSVQGQRPQGAPQGQRPQGSVQGQRPQGSVQGQRPQGVPQGQRPQGAPQGQRPQGVPQGQRPQGVPQGQRPQGAPQGQRPQGAVQGQRPQGAVQGQRPQGAPQSAPMNMGGTPQGMGGAPQSQRPAPQNAGFKAKNFMTDDDEFEFEFLNWDGEEE